ncbi:endonuclease VII domain-containing protein [Pseudoblastomonas flavescens]|uniref:endonuclease VII domain-containing protein n=1 Tax=Alteriqipengyuania flavescens TaxID=3053610 RepID=UPI00384B2FC7
MRTYGISLLEVRAMFENQAHRCCLCGGPGFKMADHHRVPLVVDHCHTTGKVRGLLCHNCNRALGLLQDDPEVMVKAAEYIEAHREGATTIPKGSRPQATGGRSARPLQQKGEDIVWTRRQRRAAS